MTDAEIREAVLDSLRTIAPEADPEEIDPRADLREQVDLDSMDYMNFLIGIGRALEVEIPEEDSLRLRTVDDCVAYLSERLRARDA